MDIPLLDDDLMLITAKFEEPIAKERHYLYKYFTTELEQSFLQYYDLFRSYTKFTTHTGFILDNNFSDILKWRYERLIKLHKKAVEEFDMEFLVEIESGKLLIKNI